MAYEINWSLLGQPVDVAGAVRHGFEYGSALRQRQQEEQRRAEFQQSALKAYDPATGRVDAPAMRSAFARSGNIEGAMQFDRANAETEHTQQAQQREQLLNIARLLDDATDPESYARGLAVAQRMGLDVSSAPPQYDPQWVAQQRLIVREFVERPEQMTTFMRDAEAAGIHPGSPEFRQTFMNRYAPPMQAVDITQPDGSVVRQYIPRPQAGGAPPELTDDDIRALDEGGPAPAAGPATFP